MYYKGGDGVRVLYQERDMRYDVAHGHLRQEEGSLAVRVGVSGRGSPGGCQQEGTLAEQGGDGGSEERQEKGSGATFERTPGRADHPGMDEGQGEPGQDGEASETVGVPGDISPHTKTSAR